MRVGYPLPRRPCRVRDESQVVLIDLGPAIPCRNVLQSLFPALIQDERLCPFRQALRVPLLREYDARARISHDIGEQGRRVG